MKTMKVFSQAAPELEPYFRSAALAPLCRHCGEFSPSERTPSVGICWLHAVRVLAQDKACSHYYQTEVCEFEGSDDEF